MSSAGWLVTGTHHSVSAFGSSIGTLMRSSIGAAIFAMFIADLDLLVLV